MLRVTTNIFLKSDPTSIRRSGIEGRSAPSIPEGLGVGTRNYVKFLYWITFEKELSHYNIS